MDPRLRNKLFVIAPNCRRFAFLGVNGKYLWITLITLCFPFAATVADPTADTPSAKAHAYCSKIYEPGTVNYSACVAKMEKSPEATEHERIESEKAQEMRNRANGRVPIGWRAIPHSLTELLDDGWKIDSFDRVHVSNGEVNHNFQIQEVGFLVSRQGKYAMCFVRPSEGVSICQSLN